LCYGIISQHPKINGDVSIITQSQNHKISKQVDGEIVTIEIPNAVHNAWEKHDDFQTFHQESPSKILQGPEGEQKAWQQAAWTQNSTQEASPRP
jgi:hypothetical protein